MAAGSNTPIVLVLALLCGVAGGFLGAQLAPGEEQQVARAERYDDSDLRSEIAALREQIQRQQRERLDARASEAATPAPIRDGERDATMPRAEPDGGVDAPQDGLPAWIRDFEPDGYVKSLVKGRFDAGARNKLFTLLSVYGGGAQPDCAASLDCNSDGQADLADALFNLRHRFNGGPPPSLPYPGCDFMLPAECASSTCAN